MNINKIIMAILLTGSIIANSSDEKTAKKDIFKCTQAKIIRAIASKRGYEIKECEVQAIKTAANGSVAVSGFDLNSLLPILTVDHINLMTRCTESTDARK